MVAEGTKAPPRRGPRLSALEDCRLASEPDWPRSECRDALPSERSGHWFSSVGAGEPQQRLDRTQIGGARKGGAEDRALFAAMMVSRANHAKREVRHVEEIYRHVETKHLRDLLVGLVAVP